MKRSSWSGSLVVVFFLMLVGAIGLAKPVGAAGAPGQAPAAAPAAAKMMKVPALDINAATKEQLVLIPGIDDATAQKIIDGRPYRSRTELTKRNIIPLELYNKISSRITAKPVKK